MKRLIFLVIGILILILGIYLYGKQNEFINTAEKAEGTVVGNYRRSSGRNVAPIVEFVSKDNKIICFKSTLFSDPPAYDVCEKVKVYYDPMLPENAKIDSFFELWGVIAIVSSIAVVFILVGSSGMGWK